MLMVRAIGQELGMVPQTDLRLRTRLEVSTHRVPPLDYLLHSAVGGVLLWCYYNIVLPDGEFFGIVGGLVNGALAEMVAGNVSLVARDQLRMLLQGGQAPLILEILDLANLSQMTGLSQLTDAGQMAESPYLDFQDQESRLTEIRLLMGRLQPSPWMWLNRRLPNPAAPFLPGISQGLSVNGSSVAKLEEIYGAIQAIMGAVIEDDVNLTEEARVLKAFQRIGLCDRVKLVGATAAITVFSLIVGLFPALTLLTVGLHTPHLSIPFVISLYTFRTSAVGSSVPKVPIVWVDRWNLLWHGKQSQNPRILYGNKLSKPWAIFLTLCVLLYCVDQHAGFSSALGALALFLRDVFPPVEGYCHAPLMYKYLFDLACVLVLFLGFNFAIAVNAAYFIGQLFADVQYNRDPLGVARRMNQPLSRAREFQADTNIPRIIFGVSMALCSGLAALMVVQLSGESGLCESTLLAFETNDIYSLVVSKPSAFSVASAINLTAVILAILHPKGLCSGSIRLMSALFEKGVRSLICSNRRRRLWQGDSQELVSIASSQERGQAGYQAIPEVRNPVTQLLPVGEREAPAPGLLASCWRGLCSYFSPPTQIDDLNPMGGNA